LPFIIPNLWYIVSGHQTKSIPENSDITTEGCLNTTISSAITTISVLFILIFEKAENNFATSK